MSHRPLILAWMAFVSASLFAQAPAVDYDDPDPKMIERLVADLGSDDFRRQQLIDLPGEGHAARLGQVIGRRRVRLDVGAGESLDVLPRLVGRLLGAGTGKDDLLLERQALVGPELLVHSPYVLGIDNSHQALRRGGELWHMLLGVNIDSAHEDTVDRFERRQ